MFEAMGGEVSHGGHGHLIFKLNSFTHGFRDSQHELSAELGDSAVFLNGAMQLTPMPTRYSVSMHGALSSEHDRSDGYVSDRGSVP
jgi:hypothetical protein